MSQKLLIVDDESGIVDMLKAYFSPRYEVLTARSGQDAVQKARRQAGPDPAGLHCSRIEAEVRKQKGDAALALSVPALGELASTVEATVS